MSQTRVSERPVETPMRRRQGNRTHLLGVSVLDLRIYAALCVIGSTGLVLTGVMVSDTTAWWIKTLAYLAIWICAICGAAVVSLWDNR